MRSEYHLMHNSHLFFTFAAIAAFASGSKAAVVIDNPNAAVLTISAGTIGSVSTTFTNNGVFWCFGSGTGVWRGDGSFGNFSSGANIPQNDPTTIAFIAESGSTVTRYLMLDIDNSGTHETVLETTLVLSSVALSTIDRYAYNPDNSDLEISDAIQAFAAVPEPAPVCLAGLGSVLALFRRRR